MGSDEPNDLTYIKPLLTVFDTIISYEKEVPNTGNGNFPYNLYINKMYEGVEEGMIITLDDDDEFCGPKGLEIIASHIQDTDAIYVWKTKFPHIILPQLYWESHLACGDIPNCGTAFHSKYKEIGLWDGNHAADFRAIEKLTNHLNGKIIWIDGIFTKLQTGPQRGKPEK